MECGACGYDPVAIHRTGSLLISYCTGCGQRTESKREPTRERWTKEERVQRLKVSHRLKGKK